VASLEVCQELPASHYPRDGEVTMGSDQPAGRSQESCRPLHGGVEVYIQTLGRKVGMEGGTDIYVCIYTLEVVPRHRCVEQAAG
jgi:hypothetical protein